MALRLIYALLVARTVEHTYRSLPERKPEKRFMSVKVIALGLMNIAVW